MDHFHKQQSHPLSTSWSQSLYKQVIPCTIVSRQCLVSRCQYVTVGRGSHQNIRIPYINAGTHFCWHRSILISVWKSNYIHHKVWAWTYISIPNFNGAIGVTTISKWINDFIPHFTWCVCWDCDKSVLVKGAPLISIVVYISAHNSVVLLYRLFSARLQYLQCVCNGDTCTEPSILAQGA